MEEYGLYIDGKWIKSQEETFESKNPANGAREAGTTAIHEFTEIKTVFVDYSGKLQKAQIQE